MVIKKFVAATEEEAVKNAKEEFGKDVVIMNIKEHKPGGLFKLFKKPFVEVTAAVDELSEDDSKSSKEEEKPDFSKLQEAILNAENVSPAPDSKAARIEAKKEKLKQRKDIIFEEDDDEKDEEDVLSERINILQNLIEKQMTESEQQKDTNKTQNKKEENKTSGNRCSMYLELIRNQLIDNEVDEIYVDEILKDIEISDEDSDKKLNNILAGVYQKIVLKLGQPQTVDFESAKHKKYIFFVGPTGVGKTTTIAKIASMMKLSGKKNVAMITSDTYRIAAVEQLRTYANILSMPLKVVYTSDEMEKIKEELEEYDLVLVDTAGRSHNNKEQQDDIKKLINTVDEKDRDIFLVLSATTKYKDLKKISQMYKKITKYSLIFTKLDETESFGNIYNIHILTGAPLSYMTWGQNVPDDIEKTDAQKIAKMLLGGNG